MSEDGTRGGFSSSAEQAYTLAKANMTAAQIGLDIASALFPPLSQKVSISAFAASKFVRSKQSRLRPQNFRLTHEEHAGRYNLPFTMCNVICRARAFFRRLLVHRRSYAVTFALAV